MPWLPQDPCPSTNQSLETMTLRRHTEKADKYSIKILPITALSMEHTQAFLHSLLSSGHRLSVCLSVSLCVSLCLSVSLSVSLSPFPQHTCLSSLFHLSRSLSPKLQEPFFSYNLFPQSTSSMAHFFYLCDFLYKVSFIIWILALNSSLSQNSITEIGEPRLTLVAIFLPLTQSVTKPLNVKQS